MLRKLIASIMRHDIRYLKKITEGGIKIQFVWVKAKNITNQKFILRGEH